jgi:lysophospholipase L1-like esterase
VGVIIGRRKIPAGAFLSLLLLLLLAGSMQAQYLADTRTTTAPGVDTVTNRLYAVTMLGAAANNVAPLGSLIWIVADMGRDGVPTNNVTAGAVLGPDDILLWQDFVDGALLGPQPGRYTRNGVAAPESAQTADIYFYLWNVSNSIATATGPFYSPVPGDKFGLFNFGSPPVPVFGNALWYVTGDVFADTYTVGGAATPPDSSLRASWPLNEGAGTNAADATGFGHTLTLRNGVAWTSAGRIAGAITLDGTDDFLQTPDAADLEMVGQSFTLALWVRSTRAAPQMLVEKQHTGFNGPFLFALNRDNAVPGGFSVWTGSQWLDSNWRGATDGQWHHLAVSFTNGVFRLYRDGLLDRTVNAGNTYVDTALPWNFGRFLTGNVGWPFAGSLDEIRLYRRALADAEIGALANPAAVNSAPVVNAGPDLNVNLSATVNLAGSVTDDGLPSSNLTSSWSLLNGPGAVIFGNANAPVTTASFGATGQYTLRLTASDGALSGSDDVVVTVAPDPPPNQPPTVSLSLPTNGAGFVAPASIALQAAAGDADGSVTNVEFYANGSRLGAKATAPYTFTWSGVAAGVYSLTARAFDNAGASATSAVVQVTVTNPPATLGAAAGHWPLDDGNGTTATDASGNGNPMTLLNGVAWAAQGRVGGAVVLDGTDDYLRVNDAAAIEPAGRSFTVALWSRSSRTAPQMLAEKQAGGFGNALLFALNRDNAVPGGFSIWTGSQWLDSVWRGATDGQWHHLAVTFTNGTYRLYRDGLLDRTVSAGNTYGDTTLPWNFGRFVTGNVGWLFAGHLDDIRIYTRALDGAEIAALSNPNPVNQPPLVSAGTNQTVTLPAAANLAGSVTDDGLPSNSVSVAWSRVSGPGEVIFANSNSITTTATFPTNGLFVLRLTASDGALSASADVQVTVQPPPNQLPSVTLLQPTNGAFFATGANVLLAATASDPDGTVAKVEFYDAAVKLGEATTPPFEFLWLGVAAGTHPLSARAVDNAGGVGQSGIITVTVTPTGLPNQPPTIALTAPTNGGSFAAGSNLLLVANASDSDGTVAKVEFYAGAGKLGEAGAAPFQFAWNNLPAGNHTLTARAFDDLGASRTSAPVAITVTNAVVADNAGLKGHWPLDDAAGAGAQDASGNGNAGTLKNGPVWTVSGRFNGALNFDGADDFIEVPDSVSLELAGRSFTVALWARTPAGGPKLLVEKQNTGWNGEFLFALNRDGAVPGGFSVWTGNAWIDSNWRGATDNQWHHLAVTFTNGTFRLYRDGVLDRTQAASAAYADSSLPWSFGRFIVGGVGWPFSGQLDDIRIYHRALSDADLAPLAGLGPVNQPPIASLTSPANGATFTAPATLTLQATANDADGTVTRVEFYAGATKLGEAATAPYTLVWTNPPPGLHTLTARAIDDANNAGLSAAVSIAIEAAGAPVKVMPLGDSITDGFQVPGGYRIDLWQKFLLAGQSVDFVGSGNNGPPALGDKDHEGHSGQRIDQIASQLNPWLAAYQPRIILLLLGANDVAQNFPAATIKARLEALLDQIAAQLPTAHVIVSSLTPLGPAAWNLVAQDVNAAIPGMVAARVAQGKKLSFADNYAALTAADLDDGVHPNAAGYSKMANVWHAALSPLLGGNVPPQVALTSPAAGAGFTAPTNVTLAATASDTDGTVTLVEFFAGAVKLGERAAPPYQIVWTNPPTGSHTLAARATDNSNAVAVSSTVTITVSGPANTADAAGHWPFNDGAGATAADASGNGNPSALLNGVLWSLSGRVGGAVSLDGVDDYLRVNDSPALEPAGRNFTVALWVRTTRGAPQMLVEKQNTSWSGEFLFALNRDGVVPGGFSVWTGSSWIDSSWRGATDGQWHHLAVTFESGVFRLYRDGLLDRTQSAGASYADSSLPWSFGRFIVGGVGWPFAGEMDDARIYSRALTAAQISALANP